MPADPETRTATHCSYCALQRGQWVGPSGDVDARAVYVTEQSPTNAGGMCQKGWTSGELLAHPERLRAPLVRPSRDAAFTPTTWDDALGGIAGKLAALRAEHGPDSVAVFGAGGLTNEKAYLLGKFARVALGTSQIDYNGRFCMSSAAAAGNRAFGVDRGMPFLVTDLDDAELVVLAGANVAETMPPLMSHLASARLVVVDPWRTPTAERAIASGGLHLAPRPGTDLVLALGMLHAAVTGEHLDLSYVDARTSGFDDVWRVAAQWWPERAERVYGVSATDMRTVVRWLATTSRRYVLTARGAEQHAHGVDTVTAWINLSLALGLPGRPVGLRDDHRSGQLPGRARARPEVGPAARVPPHRGPGGARARRVGVGRRAVLAPGQGTQRRGAAGRAGPARRAEGAAGVRLERAGLRAGRARGRRAAGRAGPARRRRRAARRDGLARRRAPAGRAVGRGGGHDDQPGWTPARRCTGPARTMTTRARRGCSRTGSRTPTAARGWSRSTTSSRTRASTRTFPLRITTGRVLVHYQSGAQTRRVAELAATAPEVFVEVHPDTAARHGLADGDLAEVTSRRGTTTARVRCVPSLRTDTVFLPFHFGGAGAANNVTNPALDPVSGMPEFKVAAVRLEPARSPGGPESLLPG